MAREKGEKISIPIFEINGIVLKSDSNSYNVEYGNSNYYYPTISGGLKKISEMLLKEKFKDISEEDIKNIHTLIKLIEEHNDWFESLTQGF